MTIEAQEHKKQGRDWAQTKPTAHKELKII